MQAWQLAGNLSSTLEQPSLNLCECWQLSVAGLAALASGLNCTLQMLTLDFLIAGSSAMQAWLLYPAASAVPCSSSSAWAFMAARSSAMQSWQL